MLMPSAPGTIRATAAQAGIWVAQQVDPDVSYMTAETIELGGALDVDALICSVETVLDHADALHMRFTWSEDALWQQCRPPFTWLERVDVSAAADPVQAARAWIRASLSSGCDLASDPLYRTALLRLSPTRHWWFLQVHHIALDGFGYSLVQQAVADRYNARVQRTAAPALPDWGLGRIVDAEACYRAGAGFEADRGFWLEHLRDRPAPLALAPLREIGTPARSATHVLGAARMRMIRVAAERLGVDWNTWLLCAIGVWLAQRGGRHDLTFGMPVMNRLGAPTLGVPCMAMNLVPIRMHVDIGQSPRSLATAMAEQLRAIRPHLYYRYAWLRADVGLLEPNAFLFNQVVNVMPFERRIPFRGLTSDTCAVSSGPVHDLNVSVSVRAGLWNVTLEANPHAYDAATLAIDLQSLVGWLETFAGHPSDAPTAPLLRDLPPLSILRGAALPASYPDALALIERVACATPSHTAIEAGMARVTYRSLLDKVDALAAALVERGVRPGCRVAIAARGSPETIAAMLAVLRVGAVIVPIDPEGPPQRTEAMLEHAAPTLVIVQPDHRVCAGTWATLLLEPGCAGEAATPYGACAHERPDTAAVSDSAPAYLLYTSGSTGRPNGVLVGRGALAQFVASTRDLYRIGPADKVLQFAPLHFDASFEEIFVTLCAGATLVLRSEAMLDSIDVFAAEVERREITVLDLPTAYWHVLAHALDARQARRLSGVRLTIIGGEAALPDRIRRWRAHLPTQILLNTYGPTETTIIATAAQVGGAGTCWREGAPVPIGTPRAGVDACLVDECFYPVPVGQTGELVVSGDALALGYIDNPGLTSERFVTLPGSGARAYRTGDLARLHDGQLCFEGRIDHQVKISGVRIDPREIEDCLLQVPAIREAAVVALRGEAGATTLAAFVVGTDQVAALRARLADVLPPAAIPDAWHVVEALPRNANGKIDRRALTQPIESDRRPDEGRRAGPSRGESLEHRVMRIWREVLGDVALTPATRFFDVGGKSLQAIQVSARLAQELERDVPVSLLFRHATVEALAAALQTPLAYRPRAVHDAFAPHLQIQAGPDHGPRLICLHPADGLAWSYLRLAAHLPEIGLDGLQLSVDETRRATDFGALIQTYVERVRALQPRGPYRLLGWSLGGAVAHAVAAALVRAGQTVDLLALMDSYPASAWDAYPQPTRADALRILLTVNGDFDTDDLGESRLRQRLLRANSPFAALEAAGLDDFVNATWRQMLLFRAAPTPCYEGELLLFNATRKPPGGPQPDSWHSYLAPGALICHALDVVHDGMSDPEPMTAIGTVLAERFAAIAGDPSAEIAGRTKR